MSTSLARKFRVQVTSDLTLASGWVALNGISDLDPSIAPNLADTTAYDTTGWATSEVTLYTWTNKAVLYRRNTNNTYDAGQELVRATLGQFGTGARVGVRWFDGNGGPEAYAGVAVVTWDRTNTAVKDVEQVTITFTGTDVALLGVVGNTYTNPYTVALVPVINPLGVGVTPASQGAAKAVSITGANFTGATAVTFAGTAATSFSVLNDQQIVAVIPTGSAGTITVVVTNGTGPSVQTNNYVRT